LLAARLGCRQENLSRAFAALRAFGVETHGSRVILHDIPRLKALAVPDDLSDPDAF
jgi:CRP/FNR family transcriptional regulator, transcriptional activator FtrB